MFLRPDEAYMPKFRPSYDNSIFHPNCHLACPYTHPLKALSSSAMRAES